MFVKNHGFPVDFPKKTNPISKPLFLWHSDRPLVTASGSAEHKSQLEAREEMPRFCLVMNGEECLWVVNKLMVN